MVCRLKAKQPPRLDYIYQKLVRISSFQPDSPGGFVSKPVRRADLQVALRIWPSESLRSTSDQAICRVAWDGIDGGRLSAPPSR